MMRPPTELTAPLASSSSSSSQHRKRLDELLAGALVILVVVYSTVSFLTYHKISSGEYGGYSGAAVYSENQAVDVAARNFTTADHLGQRVAIQALQRTFPIHVGTDVEDIVHPGLALVKDQPPKQLARTQAIPARTLPQTMNVPKFFEDSHGHLYGGSIREYLGGGVRLPTVEQAKSIGSFNDEGRETIYCSVASYRDYECRHTVEDLFLRAKYPTRIRVAIIDQVVEGDEKCNEPIEPCDVSPFQALCQFAHQIDYYSMDARLAVGPVFARHMAHRHYRGEYFAMQIDSHVRFVQHWDDDLISQWKSARNEMAVLTTYLSDLTDSIDPETFLSKHHTRPIMCQSDYEGNGAYKHLRHGQQPEGTPMIRGQPTLHPFWAAGFSFARGHFVIQVPYDQYLPMVFQGEEISLGLRGFTYGYDYYTPERGICFHMYASRDKTDKRKTVPLFWENQATYQGVAMAAMKRLNAIIGMADPDPHEWQHDDEEKYGLGKVRNTAKFFKTFGIHTETKTVEKHLCRFVGQPMMKEFLPALRENGMGIDYDKITYVFTDPAPKDP